MDSRIASTIGNLLNKVPGYAGYRDKESRRDDDKRLRDAIAASLDSTVQALTATSAAMAEKRSFTHLSTIERLVGTTRTLADRVRTTSYGYGGIFTDRPVDEFVLDQLRQFDVTFQAEAEELAAIAGRLSTSPDGPLDVDINAYQTELNRLGKLFDGRRDVVETARPNRDAEVLALLERNPVQPPSKLTVLGRGDTLSIGNDNYLVDATITFIGQAGTVRLSRIGSGSDGKAIWLLGTTVAGQPAARLVESDSAGEVASEARAAELVVDSGEGESKAVSAQYAYTANAEQDVSFWYAVGDQARSFTGKELAETDVVVYGKAT